MTALQMLALGQIGIVLTMIAYGFRINDLERRLRNKKKLCKMWGKDAEER